MLLFKRVIFKLHVNLVGGFSPTIWNICSSNFIISWEKSGGGEIKKSLKNHHLVIFQGLVGCFLKWWYPHFTPQVLIIFSRKTQWLLGKPTIFGNPQLLRGRWFSNQQPTSSNHPPPHRSADDPCDTDVPWWVAFLELQKMGPNKNQLFQ